MSSALKTFHVSELNGCGYCVSAHGPLGARFEATSPVSVSGVKLDFRHFGRLRGKNEASSQREARGSRSKMVKVESKDLFQHLAPYDSSDTLPADRGWRRSGGGTVHPLSPKHHVRSYHVACFACEA